MESRLPEQFSAGYLERYVDSLKGRPNLVVFVGDSVLWGHGIDASQTAIAIMRERDTGKDLINLSFEGGSPVNDELMLRYLLARGVRPRLVVINLNMKEFSAGDSAFRRLRPALEVAAEPQIVAGLRANLDLQDHSSINERASRFVEKFWLLYRYRTDLREAIFGTDDFASWLRNLGGAVSRYTARYAAAHVPKADDFEGTYDLAPLDPHTNLSYRRLLVVADLLRREQIPVIGFLTPTNHRLLHDYIDNPEYRANVATVKSTLTREGMHVINLDSAMPSAEFIDNDHLTAAGNIRLANRLQTSIDRLFRGR